MASPAWTSYKERVRQLSDQLVDAQRPIRIRDAIQWDDSIEQQVTACRFKKLPQVDAEYYRQHRPLPYVPADKIEEFARIERAILDGLGAEDAIGRILLRNCREYQDAIRMLEARGTPEFHKISCRLYGSPQDRFAGDNTTILDLGMTLYEILSGIPEDGLRRRLAEDAFRRGRGQSAQHPFWHVLP